MPDEPNHLPRITSVIRTIRGQRVILDADLAAIYGVPTGRLNEQVKRNRTRFAPDFMFQLTQEETVAVVRLRSQFAILKRGQHLKYRPYAFTEYGAIMAANVLNSPLAVRISVMVVRAFVRCQGILGTNKELADQLAKLEAHVGTHDRQIHGILEAIRQLMTPPDPPRRKIGFQTTDQSRDGPVGRGRLAIR